MNFKSMQIFVLATAFLCAVSVWSEEGQKALDHPKVEFIKAIREMRSGALRPNATLLITPRKCREGESPTGSSWEALISYLQSHTPYLKVDETGYSEKLFVEFTRGRESSAPSTFGIFGAEAGETI